jgi:hypothetical protein
MQCLTIDTEAIKAVLLPMRGMGIWKTWVQGIEFGWQSPVAGPVHPSLVPVGDPSGIGWLEGFDELLVRCDGEEEWATQPHATRRHACTPPPRPAQMRMCVPRCWTAPT